MCVDGIEFFVLVVKMMLYVEVNIYFFVEVNCVFDDLCNGVFNGVVVLIF